VSLTTLVVYVGLLGLVYYGGRMDELPVFICVNRVANNSSISTTQLAVFLVESIHILNPFWYFHVEWNGWLDSTTTYV